MSKLNLKEVFFVGLSAFCLVGCENLPGNKGTQGAVIGGASGATVGAVIGGEKHRLLGAILGGAAGAAGGYVIGANSDKITGRDRKSAEDSARQSQEQPATSADALKATSADINNDGFVTLDEVVAMREAGLTDTQMLDRMRVTGQIFELTTDQRQYLIDRGVSRSVVDQMEDLNQETRERLGSNRTLGTSPAPNTPPVIGQPPVSVPQRN
jgi:hypothetical protein